MNSFEGVLGDGGLELHVENRRDPLPAGHQRLASYSGQPLRAVLRPEYFSYLSAGDQTVAAAGTTVEAIGTLDRKYQEMAEEIEATAAGQYSMSENPSTIPQTAGFDRSRHGNLRTASGARAVRVWILFAKGHGNADRLPLTSTSSSAGKTSIIDTVVYLLLEVYALNDRTN